MKITQYDDSKALAIPTTKYLSLNNVMDPFFLLLFATDGIDYIHIYRLSVHVSDDIFVPED